MNPVDSAHDPLQLPNAANAPDLQTLSDADRDDICSDPFDEGCTASLDDGEGWNGACGNCADRQYAAEEGQWWQDKADDENKAEGSTR